METLPQERQDAVWKCSSERLRENLIKAGYADDEVAKMSRDELLEAWAQVGALKNHEPLANEYVTTLAYDPSLEKERLEF